MLEEEDVFHFRGLAILGSSLVKFTLEKLVQILLLLPFSSLINVTMETLCAFVYWSSGVAVGQVHVGEDDSDLQQRA